MFQPYVICRKRGGGTAVIAREEFLTYKASRRKREFSFILWLSNPCDENIAVRRFPGLSSVVAWAHRMGMGNSMRSW